jgi:hypothetical protein
LNEKHLLWILPICAFIFFIIGFVVVGVTGGNMVVEKCNQQYEFQNALCDLQCDLSDTIMNTLEYYEENCPEIANKIN